MAHAQPPRPPLSHRSSCPRGRLCRAWRRGPRARWRRRESGEASAAGGDPRRRAPRLARGPCAAACSNSRASLREGAGSRRVLRGRAHPNPSLLFSLTALACRRGSRKRRWGGGRGRTCWRRGPAPGGVAGRREGARARAAVCRRRELVGWAAACRLGCGWGLKDSVSGEKGWEKSGGSASEAGTRKRRAHSPPRPPRSWPPPPSRKCGQLTSPARLPGPRTASRPLCSRSRLR
jgi:hypothetical protein